MSSKTKFAKKLANAALSDVDWEKEEVSKLLLLIMKQLKFDNEGRYQFLVDLQISDPELLACMEELDIPPAIIIQLLLHGGVGHFLKRIGNSFDQGLLTLNDEETRHELIDLPVNWDNLNFLRRYAYILAEHSNTKQICGIILDCLTDSMEAHDGRDLIQDIICREFFLDLKGPFADFVNELNDEVLRSRLQEDMRNGKDGRKLTQDGRLVESDEDENGNLRGFIDDESDGEGEESSGSENRSDGSAGSEDEQDHEFIECGSEDEELLQEDDGDDDDNDDDDDDDEDEEGSQKPYYRVVGGDESDVPCALESEYDEDDNGEAEHSDGDGWSKKKIEVEEIDAPTSQELHEHYMLMYDRRLRKSLTRKALRANDDEDDNNEDNEEEGSSGGDDEEVVDERKRSRDKHAAGHNKRHRNGKRPSR